jgi:hypothetical protein
MKKRRMDAEFDDFYNVCLAELKARPNYTDAFLPILDRYVMLTVKLGKLNSEIVDSEIVVEHINKKDHKNEASSPAWRMFLALNREASMLAKELGLSPVSAPKTEKKGDKKRFELGGEMKVSKAG